MYTDNVTALVAINKNDSTNSRAVTKEVSKLRDLCKATRIHVSMLRIPGDQNLVADSFSRGEVMPGELEVTPHDWNRIQSSTPGE